VDITAGRVAIAAALREVVLPLCQCYHVDGKGEDALRPHSGAKGLTALRRHSRARGSHNDTATHGNLNVSNSL